MPKSLNVFVHRRVTDAEYRVRKFRNGADRYVVTEWYKGDRTQLVDICDGIEAARTLARSLADRDSF